MSVENLRIILYVVSLPMALVGFMVAMIRAYGYDKRQRREDVIFQASRFVCAVGVIGIACGILYDFGTARIPTFLLLIFAIVAFYGYTMVMLLIGLITCHGKEREKHIGYCILTIFIIAAVSGLYIWHFLMQIIN